MAKRRSRTQVGRIRHLVRKRTVGSDEPRSDISNFSPAVHGAQYKPHGFPSEALMGSSSVELISGFDVGRDKITEVDLKSEGA